MCCRCTDSRIFHATDNVDLKSTLVASAEATRPRAGVRCKSSEQLTWTQLHTESHGPVFATAGSFGRIIVVGTHAPVSVLLADYLQPEAEILRSSSKIKGR